jgi:L-threonylcarbamoyladenylate synthase
MPRVLTVDPHAPDPEIVAEATRVLLGGGLVAFPTETVYGLGACALDPAAVAKIFVAKGRPPGHPLIVHVLGSSDARELASSWTLAAERLAAFFWPGALTLVVDRGQSVPAEVTGGGSSVAIRATSHPLARALIAAAGPLAAPSANRYQSLSATSAAHVVKSLGDGVDLVLDGGASWAGIESTVVDARGPSLRLLRPGAVSAEAIRALGMELIAATSVAPPSAASEVHESPGQDAKHYAPRCRAPRGGGARRRHRQRAGLRRGPAHRARHPLEHRPGEHVAAPRRRREGRAPGRSGRLRPRALRDLAPPRRCRCRAHRHRSRPRRRCVGGDRRSLAPRLVTLGGVAACPCLSLGSDSS